jgi:hypothetical protein
MFSLQTTKRGRPRAWVAMFLPLFVGLAVNPDAGAESEGIEHPSRVSLFGGIAQDDSDFGASFGLEYEYRMHGLWGIGGLAEYAGDDFDAWVVGVPVFLHPYAGSFIRLAPGLEFEEDEAGLLFRTGVGYDFELSPWWSLAPEFNVGFIEGGDTKLVHGLSLSYSF